MKENCEKINSYVQQILYAIKSIDPKIVILFGSIAKGNVEEDSDIDLLVVLNEKDIPLNYDEKLEMKLKIRQLIRKVNKKVSIDLLVYTLPEYEEFIKNRSSFSKEILETGKVLYEQAG